MKLEEPKLTVIAFDEEDIIRTSGEPLETDDMPL